MASALSEIVLREITLTDGALAKVVLTVDAGEIVFRAGSEAPVALPERVLTAVVERYGAPFDESEAVAVVAALTLPSGATLSHVRHLARFDVVARDYLVHAPAGAHEKTCASSAVVAGAIEHLVTTAASPA